MGLKYSEDTVKSKLSSTKFSRVTKYHAKCKSCCTFIWASVINPFPLVRHLKRHKDQNVANDVFDSENDEKIVSIEFYIINDEKINLIYIF